MEEKRIPVGRAMNTCCRLGCFLRETIPLYTDKISIKEILLQKNAPKRSNKTKIFEGDELAIPLQMLQFFSVTTRGT